MLRHTKITNLYFIEDQLKQHFWGDYSIYLFVPMTIVNMLRLAV